MTDTKHFIDLDGLDLKTLRSILDASTKLKSGSLDKNLNGKQLAMIFEKASTRTRVSFEVAINQLGGDAIILNTTESQIGRGETISDTAKVLSRYADIIMIRTFKHETLTEMAEHSTIPVINGLTNYSHPCQLLADIMTFEEKLGSIEGKTIAWIGDCNNMANTWIQASEKFKFQLNISSPEELSPPANLPSTAKIFEDPKEAAKGADCITTDTWVSMGDEDADHKRSVLAGHQVNEEIMALAKENAIFLHCLPAHREEEVSTSVIDGEQSAVWDEAENRLHTQKAIMLWCLGQLG